jgi:flagellar motor protein MotB
MPIGKIVDTFHEELTSTEIDELQKGYRKHLGSKGYMGVMDYSEESQLVPGQLIFPDQADINAYGNYYDQYGNAKVSHVIWTSFTEVMKLEYPDEDGEMQETYISAEYKPREEKGEKGTKEWIREYWHGYKIANQYYVKMEPLPRIGSKFNNPSVCKPPVVGTTYTYNNQKPISLLDRAKPYKYLYDIYMRRAELASARDKGIMAEMDFARIPDGWEPDVWMAYAEMYGWLATDSFKTGNKGPAQGKLVGNMQQTANRTVNLSNAESIKTNLEMAQYIKREMSEILGVPPQRLGQMKERETAGGIDMSIEKSAHITEEWFFVHDDTKIRLLELYLETAKNSWKDYTSDKPKVLDFIDDNLIRNIYRLDGAEFSMNHYGLFIDHSLNTKTLLQKISSWGLAAMQNDKIDLSALIDAERDHSVIGKIKKIEQSEEKAHNRQLEMLRAQQELKARETRLKEIELKLEDKHKQQELAMEKYEIDMEAQKGMQDLDKDGLRDSTELQREKLEQEYETERLRIQIEADKEIEKAKNDLERRKLRQEKELRLKELAQRYAPKYANQS